MLMVTAREWLKVECELDMPEGNINGAWFAVNNLPMIVECACCGSTMALPFATVDGNGNVYCTSCAGE